MLTRTGFGARLVITAKYMVPNDPQSVAVDDFNNDHHLDIVASYDSKDNGLIESSSNASLCGPGTE